MFAFHVGRKGDSEGLGEVAEGICGDDDDDGDVPSVGMVMMATFCGDDDDVPSLWHLWG